jgi:nucleoside phosphorylase
VDVDRLTFACATVAERDAGRKAGLGTALIGLRGRNGLPGGRLVSFGLAGALDEDLPCGTVLDAVEVVDAEGTTLWRGEPLGVPGARPATIVSTDDVVDDPDERRRLRERTGADAVDCESGVIARTGRMGGCLRVISDTPARRLNGICDAVRPEGPYDWAGMARAFARSPVGFSRAAADGKRALRTLRQAAEALA